MTDRKTELAFVISDLGSGGAQRVLVTMANAWAQSGRGIAVVTFSAQDEDFFILDERVKRVCLNKVGVSSGVFGGLSSNIGRVTALRRTLKNMAPQNVMGFIGTTNVLVVIASLGLGMRTLISERNDPTRQSFGRMWDTLRRWVYRYADVVTANSDAALEMLSAYVPKRKLALLPNPLREPDTNSVRTRTGQTILAVGRLYPQKGYDILLEAFAQFQVRHPDWRLLVLGDGPLRIELHQQANRLGLGDHVIWKGVVDDPFPFYQSADIFVMSSRHEGTPNALLEAMSAATPAIVTDAIVGALKYVENDVSGQVVPVNDPDALAQAFARLAGDEAFRKRLGENGKNRVSNNTLDNVLNVWEQVLGWNMHSGRSKS